VIAKSVPNAVIKPPFIWKWEPAALLFEELAVVADGWEVDDGAHGTGTPL